MKIGEMPHPQLDGFDHELAAFEIFASLGYSVEFAANQTCHHDLIVNGFLVQVKKRTTNKSNRWSFNLVPRVGRTAYLHGQVDFFVIVLDGFWHVVPACRLERSDGSIANSLAIRKIADFRDAFHLLDGPRHITERQLGFDF
jgi:hypothetical protein